MKLWEKTMIDSEEKKEEGQKLMLLALLPSIFVGLVRFGTDAFAILLLSVGTGAVFDFIYAFLQKKEEKEEKKLHYGDLLICLLFGLVLPPGLPWYCVVGGSFFALLIGKYAFKRRGDYFLNPALIAKAFLLLSFAGPMGRVFYQGQILKTPLESLMVGEGVNTMKLFLGNTAGSIGTLSVLAVLLGAAFLLWFDLFHVETPLGILAGFLVIAAFCKTPVEGMHDFHYLVAECCSGGLLFGAFFMATDPKLLPKGHLQQFVYGLFIGLTAACLRFYGNSKEGITYAILAGNLLLPLADRIKSIREKRKEKKEAGVGGND